MAERILKFLCVYSQKSLPLKKVCGKEEGKTPSMELSYFYFQPPSKEQSIWLCCCKRANKKKKRPRKSHTMACPLSCCDARCRVLGSLEYECELLARRLYLLGNTTATHTAEHSLGRASMGGANKLSKSHFLTPLYYLPVLPTGTILVSLASYPYNSAVACTLSIDIQ